MSGAEPVRVSPEEVTFALLSGIPDDQLPMLAAEWLSSGGYDSDLLREVAGMSRRAGLDARRLFPELLASLGYDVANATTPWDDSPWRGYWGRIAWCIAPNLPHVMPPSHQDAHARTPTGRRRKTPPARSGVGRSDRLRAG